MSVHPTKGCSPLKHSTPFGVPLASPVPGDSRRPDRVERQRHGLCPNSPPIIPPRCALLATGAARDSRFPRAPAIYDRAARHSKRRFPTPARIFALEFPTFRFFQNVGLAHLTPQNSAERRRVPHWFPRLFPTFSAICTPTLCCFGCRFSTPKSGRKPKPTLLNNPFATTAQQSRVG